MRSSRPTPLNSELRRFLEKELLERVRSAERAYGEATKPERRTNARKALLSGLASDAGVLRVPARAMERYHQALIALSEFLLHQKTTLPQDLLDSVLKVAVEATGADMGNIQTWDRSEGALRIQTQCGFRRPFLDFFARVDDSRGSSCGKALQAAGPVIVEDVRRSAIFAGTASLGVLLDAGVQACQSTPVVNPAGELVGMLNTHYRKPARPDDRDLDLIKQLANQAALLIGAA